MTAVRVSDDLEHARVYVRLLRAEVDEQGERAASWPRSIERQDSCGGSSRRGLQLKYQPELRFFWDEGGDQAARIEELLREERREGDAP